MMVEVLGGNRVVHGAERERDDDDIGEWSRMEVVGERMTVSISLINRNDRSF